MPKKFYVDFTGRAQLGSHTIMEYFGDDPMCKPKITIHEWSYLDDNQRKYYVIENASLTLDGAIEIEYDQLDIEIVDKQ